MLGDRQAVIGRELTKLHEEFRRGRFSELLEWYGQNKPRGEFTLLVEGAATSSTEQVNPAAEGEALSDEAVLQAVNKLIASGVNKKDAIKMTASSLELPRRRVYQLVIKSD